MHGESNKSRQSSLLVSKQNHVRDSSSLNLIFVGSKSFLLLPVWASEPAVVCCLCLVLSCVVLLVLLPCLVFVLSCLVLSCLVIPCLAFCCVCFVLYCIVLWLFCLVLWLCALCGGALPCFLFRVVLPVCCLLLCCAVFFLFLILFSYSHSFFLFLFLVLVLVPVLSCPVLALLVFALPFS